MALTKQYLKTKPQCKVTFVVPAANVADAQEIALVGEFSDWQDQPMKKQKNGDFSVTVTLAKDTSYQFRYRVGADQWRNDEAADAYVPSPVSWEQNSVVQV